MTQVKPASFSKADAASGEAGERGSGLPCKAGVGLRHPHVQEFLERRPPAGFLEVHSENYLSDGGPRLRALLDLRRDYDISCHGVGLSLGSAEGLNNDHLARLNTLFARVQPAAISEHVSWSITDGVYLNDLLPLPYTEEALDILCRNITKAQDVFGRPLLLENPSTYLEIQSSAIPEGEFLAEMVRRTGCGLLLDLNNLYVTASNNGIDPDQWLSCLLPQSIGEIHLAGHSKLGDSSALLIDDHGSAVAQPVWDLLTKTLHSIGPRPVLIEWDTRIPELPVLMAEMVHAQQTLGQIDTAVAHHAA
jgi:uncharacterized protein (UPF0276 family)